VLCGTIALALAGCGGPSNNGGDPSIAVAAVSAAPGVSRPDAVASTQIARKVGPNETAAPLGPPNLLTYSGNRVVSNMQVVEVIYGSGSYLPQIVNTTSPSVGTFYQGVLNSPYVAWLTEYNTTAPIPIPRTNQTIGNGSFAGLMNITPSAANDGATITDAEIQAELSAQIGAGTLPAPTHDAAGNNNTYYAIYFPHGKVETLGSLTSCIDFCAYHGTIANAGGKGEVYYGVQPDFQTGSGCEFGCGAAPTAFGNVTQVASHEMVETMTDAEIGIGLLAWDDIPDNQEIGDLCNDQHGTIVGSDGVTYDIQLMYDNATGNCIASKSTPVNQPPSVNAGPDQTITLPAVANLNGVVTDDGLPNPPGMVTVLWTKVSGPGTVTFGNATAAVTTASFSAPGVYVLQLTASDSQLQGSDQIQITVNGAASPCTGLCTNPKEYTINGSFQSGPIGTGAVCLETKAVVHGGNCGNFVSPRTLSVNGVQEPCNNLNWTSIPPARNGGYCITTTAGNQPWAFITNW
jgi:hypothetical protein